MLLVTISLLLAVIAFLIFVNAFYVAAEFSSVVARKPRLAQLSEEGNTRADFVLEVVEKPRRLDTYVATCQIGITVSSLTLGYYGQARMMAILEPYLDLLNPAVRVLATSIAAVIVLTSFTILQVIFGELLPKNIGLLHPERLAIMTATGMRWSLRIFAPLIWILNGSGTAVLRLLGSDVASEVMHAHSPSEIELLVEESSAGGVLDDAERRLLVNTLRLRNVTAQRAMIPRNVMMAAPVDSTCEELLTLLATSQYSRLPLYGESIDTIVGVIHLKDLICAVRSNRSSSVEEQIVPQNCLHESLFVPERAYVGEVMSIMQAHHQNLAIVVDEYGGTAGMITLEDLVEEIVGEFSDEFDVDSQPVEILEGNRLRLQGDLAIDDMQELLDLDLEKMGNEFRNIETVGGLVLTLAGRIPLSGEVFMLADIPIRTDVVIDNRIDYVTLPLSSEQAVEIVERMKEL